MLGGGMRQTGWLCTCGLLALSPENIARLADDHEHALHLARGLAGLPTFEVDLGRTQTNYVLTRVVGERFDAPGMVAAMRERGVLATASGGELIRFVTSSQVDGEDIAEALRRIGEIISRR
jgi:threonine aldolase